MQRITSQYVLELWKAGESTGENCALVRGAEGEPRVVEASVADECENTGSAKVVARYLDLADIADEDLEELPDRYAAALARRLSQQEEAEQRYRAERPQDRDRVWEAMRWGIRTEMGLGG